MASVTAKEIPEEQKFFTELWNLRKKYYIPEDNDEYWDSAIRDFTELRTKYEKLSIAYEMVMIIINDLDKRYKEDMYGKE